MNSASLRGTVQTVKVEVAAERRIRQDEGSLTHQVQYLRDGFAYRDRDLRHLHDRCADLEDAQARDRRAQREHLEWFHHVYAHLATLETRAPPSVAAAPAAPAVPVLTPDDLAQVMDQVLRQISSSLDSQSH
jgi:hypothetical protein